VKQIHIQYLHTYMYDASYYKHLCIYKTKFKNLDTTKHLRYVTSLQCCHVFTCVLPSDGGAAGHSNNGALVSERYENVTHTFFIYGCLNLLRAWLILVGFFFSSRLNLRYSTQY